ncbi:hypothetical protein D3C85_788750 [compost metagenome]
MQHLVDLRDLAPAPLHPFALLLGLLLGRLTARGPAAERVCRRWRIVPFNLFVTLATQARQKRRHQRVQQVQPSSAGVHRIQERPSACPGRLLTDLHGSKLGAGHLGELCRVSTLCLFRPRGGRCLNGAAGFLSEDIQ